MLRPDFRLVRTPGGRVLRIADLVDDDPTRRDRVAAALRDPVQRNSRDHVDIVIGIGHGQGGALTGSGASTR